MNDNDRHYSLRWNNHQNHILASIDALLQAEMLVDVTLVCPEMSIKAHKMVLSACSPLFERIFAETNCKHPVIILQGFQGWEIQSLVDFMYKGEISVIQEHLQRFIKAAESLQVRGLIPQDHFDINKENTTMTNQTSTPSISPDYDRNFMPNNRFPTPGVTMRTAERSPPFSPVPGMNFESNVKLPHMSRLSFPENMQPRQDCQSPNPRRKQARPRRRSGEICGAQDLSTNTSVPKTPSPTEETAENLCIKKTRKDVCNEEESNKNLSPVPSGSPEMDLSMPNSTNNNNKEFSRCSPPVSLPPTMSMKQEIDSQSPLTFPPMPSVSAITMTSPHSKYFGLDSHLGLFPPGLEGCRNPLFDLDPRNTPDTQMFVKKKTQRPKQLQQTQKTRKYRKRVPRDRRKLMGRPKGQHSAPRGGPPRSWTNAELTEALQHVWNKKMTTSQASRIFGIPYNSLLMYVRGKYGKSLKLEQLRKDCIGGPNPQLEIMNMSNPNSANNNNNTPCKPDREPEPIQPNTRPPSTEEQNPQQPSMFHPFSHGFYPEFGSPFPIPINVFHNLFPQSDKNRDYPPQQPPHQIDSNCIKKERMKEPEEDPQDVFRQVAHSMDEHPDSSQQNGQE